MGWPYQQKPPMGWPLDYDSGIADFVGAWFMREGSGNQINDLSGNGNTGTLFGTAHFVAGKFGSGIEFDGDSDYITSGISQISGYPFTIITWFKTTQAGTRPVLWAGNTGAGAEYVYIGNSAGNFYLVARNTDTIATLWAGNANDGQWHQIVGVFSSATARHLYVDGVWRATGTTSVNFPTLNGVSFGRLGDSSPGDYFPGTVDNASIYNRALSASEIALLYRYPFWMFKDPAEVALLGGYQVAVGTILPQITSAYMRI